MQHTYTQLNKDTERVSVALRAECATAGRCQFEPVRDQQSPAGLRAAAKNTSSISNQKKEQSNLQLH